MYTRNLILMSIYNFVVNNFRSFTRPMLSVRSNTRITPSQDLEGILSPYDYSNRRDADNFCPVVNADSDNDDHHDPGMTFDDHTVDFASQNDATKTIGQFSGDNLIAAPNIVCKFSLFTSAHPLNSSCCCRWTKFKLIMPRWPRRWI
jgi:hypothetical protein